MKLTQIIKPFPQNWETCFLKPIVSNAGIVFLMRVYIGNISMKVSKTTRKQAKLNNPILSNNYRENNPNINRNINY